LYETAHFYFTEPQKDKDDAAAFVSALGSAKPRSAAWSSRRHFLFEELSCEPVWRNPSSWDCMLSQAVATQSHHGLIAQTSSPTSREIVFALINGMIVDIATHRFLSPGNAREFIKRGCVAFSLSRDDESSLCGLFDALLSAGDDRASAGSRIATLTSYEPFASGQAAGDASPVAMTPLAAIGAAARAVLAPPAPSSAVVPASSAPSPLRKPDAAPVLPAVPVTALPGAAAPSTPPEPPAVPTPLSTSTSISQQRSDTSEVALLPPASSLATVAAPTLDTMPAPEPTGAPDDLQERRVSAAAAPAPAGDAETPIPPTGLDASLDAGATRDPTHAAQIDPAPPTSVTVAVPEPPTVLYVPTAAPEPLPQPPVAAVPHLWQAMKHNIAESAARDLVVARLYAPPPDASLVALLQRSSVGLAPKALAAPKGQQTTVMASSSVPVGDESAPAPGDSTSAAAATSAADPAPAPTLIQQPLSAAQVQTTTPAKPTLGRAASVMLSVPQHIAPARNVTTQRRGMVIVRKFGGSNVGLSVTASSFAARLPTQAEAAELGAVPPDASTLSNVSEPVERSGDAIDGLDVAPPDGSTWNTVDVGDRGLLEAVLDTLSHSHHR
jgi:hypothetical protein